MSDLTSAQPFTGWIAVDQYGKMFEGTLRMEAAWAQDALRRLQLLEYLTAHPEPALDNMTVEGEHAHAWEWLQAQGYRVVRCTVTQDED